MMAIDEGKLNTFVEQLVSDFGALTHAATTVAGDQFGLYEVLAKGPATAVELASRTHTAPRYLREWWSAQAASAYVRYELEDNLTPVGPDFFSLPLSLLSARPLHVRRRWDCVWLPRPARPACAMSSRKAASAISGAPARHRST
jgi:hypothetical protein